MFLPSLRSSWFAHRMARVALLIPALGAAATEAACRRPAVAPADAADRAPVTVTTMTVGLRDGTDVVEVGGTVRGGASVLVAARTLAPVRAVLVTAGQYVRAGQLLAQLDDRDVTASANQARAGAVAAERGVAAAEGQVTAAEAAAALARAAHTRIATLEARRSATAQELDEATAATKAADARLASARATLDQARASLDAARAGGEAAAAVAAFAQAVAPFDGRVTETFVDPGDLVSPGAPIARVEDTRSLELHVRVDESLASGLIVGAELPLSLDGSRGRVSRTGRVAEVSRATDVDSRTTLVKITLPVSDDLQPGAFGRARLSGAARRVLTVPATAVIRSGQLTSLFVVTDGRAATRLVRTGRELGQDLELLAGVVAGEAVVVDPPPSLVDGARVTTGAAR